MSYLSVVSVNDNWTRLIIKNLNYVQMIGRMPRAGHRWQCVGANQWLANQFPHYPYMDGYRAKSFALYTSVAASCYNSLAEIQATITGARQQLIYQSQTNAAYT